MKTTKLVISLSIGSLKNPCPSEADRTSAPPLPLEPPLPSAPPLPAEPPLPLEPPLPPPNPDIPLQ